MNLIVHKIFSEGYFVLVSEDRQTYYHYTNSAEMAHSQQEDHHRSSIFGQRVNRYSWFATLGTLSSEEQFLFELDGNFPVEREPVYLGGDYAYYAKKCKNDRKFWGSITCGRNSFFGTRITESFLHAMLMKQWSNINT